MASVVCLLPPNSMLSIVKFVSRGYLDGPRVLGYPDSACNLILQLVLKGWLQNMRTSQIWTVILNFQFVIILKGGCKMGLPARYGLIPNFGSNILESYEALLSVSLIYLHLYHQSSANVPIHRQFGNTPEISFAYAPNIFTALGPFFPISTKCCSFSSDSSEKLKAPPLTILIRSSYFPQLQCPSQSEWRKLTMTIHKPIPIVGQIMQKSTLRDKGNLFFFSIP